MHGTVGSPRVPKSLTPRGMVPIVAVILALSMALPIGAMGSGTVAAISGSGAALNTLDQAITSLAGGQGPAAGSPVLCTASSLTQANCAPNALPPATPHPGIGNGTWISLTSGRCCGGLAYDPVIGRALLFGGENATGPLGDTWAFRAGSWGQVLTTPSPSAREWPAMTYDAKDGYVLLFGGYNGSGYLNDTWVYQGGAWQLLSTPVAPSPRAGAGITYDPLDGAVILYGGVGPAGYLNDTWEFSGGIWSQLNTTGGLGGRAESAMTYDAGDKLVVLFGGYNGGYLGDTWTLVGHRWSEITPSVSPGPRSEAAMAWDPTEHAVILFGGTDGSALGDTWSFSAGAWTALPASGPSPRAGALMTFDPAGTDDYLLLTSGAATSTSYLGDSWALEASGWTEISTGASPGARSGSTLVWDALDGVVVLFGGMNGGTYLNDTWEFIAGAWNELSTPVAPSPRAGASMVFLGATAYAKNGYVLLFGGVGPGGYLNDTWKFLGGSWTPLQTLDAPTPRAGAAATYNSFVRSAVLFGGIGPAGYLGGTWWFDRATETWTATSPSTSPSARAYAGVTFDLVNNTMLLFGGVGPSGYLNDTWELHGGNATTPVRWTQDVRSVAPSPRANATLVWDEVARYAILLGGNGPSGILGGMWVFLRGNWSAVAPASTPDSRTGAVAVFDPADYTWVLFGGLRPTGPVGGTWEWALFIVRAFGALTPLDATAVEPFYPTVFLGVPPYTFYWTFGDGSSSHLRTPDHAYAAPSPPGGYQISLTVNDSATNHSTTFLNLTVNPALTINASGSPTVVDPGVPVAFTGAYKAGTGPYSYAWTFGDGTSSSSLSPQHAYATPGTYVATFWVNDSGGMSLNQTIPITVVSPPVSQVTASPATTDVGSPVNFSALLSGGAPPYTYTWLFGDGTQSPLANPTHTYGSAGTFLVQLWVNDSLAQTAYSSTTVTVNPTLTVSVAAVSTTVETGRAVGFWANETGGTAPYAVSWTFGDGSVGTGANPVHAYSLPGNYSVGVWVNDSVGESVHQTLTLTVTQGPTVGGSASPTTTDTGLPVTFDATVAGGVPPYTIEWAFGGNTSATGPSVSHAFATAGAWRVTVWGNDSKGGVSEQSFTVQVQPLPAISLFAVSSSEVRAGSSVGFTVTASGGTGALVYSYTGLPGGCSSQNLATLNCTPTQGGLFNITVSVTDAVGGSTTASVQLTVTPSGSSSGFLGITGGDWLWVIIGVAAVVVIVLAVLLLVSRPGRPGRTPPPARAAPPGPRAPSPSPSNSGPRSP